MGADAARAGRLLRRRRDSGRGGSPLGRLGPELFLAGLGVQVDVIATSEGWGVQKPAAAFFAKVAEVAGVPAARIAYVGDRLDNDVLPARAAGMVAVFIRRGPWGVLHARQPEIERAHIRLESLAELPAALAALSFAPPSGG